MMKQPPAAHSTGIEYFFFLISIPLMIIAYPAGAVWACVRHAFADGVREMAGEAAKDPNEPTHEI
jgi:hypothetical protein